jgi:hypothetical protein
MQLGSLESEQLLPESACKSWIMIKNNRMMHAMEFEDIIHKTLSHGGCCEHVMKSKKMSIFGKMIHDYHDD